MSRTLFLLLCYFVASGLFASAPSSVNGKEAAAPKDTKKPSPEKKPLQDPKKGSQPPQKPATPAPVNIKRLADAIQKQYNNLKTATFDFEQSYKHPFLAVTETSKGKVAYNKTSGSMVWDYQEPKERQKKFYIHGKKFTYYSISDKIAYTHDCYEKDTLSASVAFLLGFGKLTDAFSLHPLEGELPNAALSWLVLIPKEQNSPVKKISLGVRDAKVVESLVEDPSGGKNHFKFINFKTNPKIDNSVFTFKAPQGVLVQPMPNVQCPEPPTKTKASEPKKITPASKK